jgi:hypothetical protein
VLAVIASDLGVIASLILSAFVVYDLKRVSRATVSSHGARPVQRNDPRRRRSDHLGGRGCHLLGAEPDPGEGIGDAFGSLL